MASYDFVDLAADTIIDPSGSLAPFFAALDSIKSDGATVPIIHFGDSHIQGGMLTSATMRRFARRYGTAGRGFVSPHRLTGKNEPRDYAITSSAASRGGATIIDAGSRTMQMGVSGVAAVCAAGSNFTIRTFPLDDDPTDYRFSRIIAFHDSLAPVFTAADERLLDDAGGSDIFNSYSTEINLLEPTDSITLRTYRDENFANGLLYGFSLENGKPGVIYHSLGVNGACFLHWGRHRAIAEQSSALTPRLIIISLGSNEASGHNFIQRVLTDQMDSFISNLKEANPNTPILLVTPAEAMRVKGKSQTPNANFPLLVEAMKSYALQNNIALFDLYGATSGAGSATRWREAGLLARDGIHNTAEGYNLQGILLYNAIRNLATQYSSTR